MNFITFCLTKISITYLNSIIPEITEKALFPVLDMVAVFSTGLRYFGLFENEYFLLCLDLGLPVFGVNAADEWLLFEKSV